MNGLASSFLYGARYHELRARIMLSRTENFSVVVQPLSHLEHILCAGQNVDVVAPSVSVDFARQLYVQNSIADTVIILLKLVLTDKFTVQFKSGHWLN